MGENCKYNGGNNYSEKVAEFVKGHEVIALCPEVMGGLPTPRVPAEIVNGVVTNREGVLVDREFRLGAQKVLEEVIKQGAELAILQSRSPSCGAKEIYDGSFSRQKIPGMGVFAQLLAEHGIPVLDLEDVPEKVQLVQRADGSDAVMDD